jgi:hypothetical protein
VLFEASTTSGSNVPEGNERVVCSGLFGLLRFVFITRNGVVVLLVGSRVGGRVKVNGA